MQVLLDTHVWVWWVADPGQLSSDAGEAIDAAETIGVSSISCWEVAMLSRKGRLSFDRPVELWVRQALSRHGVQAIPPAPQVATAAGLLDAEFPGDPADRFIYATARATGSTLLTRDRELREFDPRGTLW